MPRRTIYASSMECDTRMLQLLTLRSMKSRLLLSWNLTRECPPIHLSKVDCPSLGLPQSLESSDDQDYILRVPVCPPMGAMGGPRG